MIWNTITSIASSSLRNRCRWCFKTLSSMQGAWLWASKCGRQSTHISTRVAIGCLRSSAAGPNGQRRRMDTHVMRMVTVACDCTYSKLLCISTRRAIPGIQLNLRVILSRNCTVIGPNAQEPSSDAPQARRRHWPASSASATPPSLHCCLQLARKPSQISRSWRVWNGIMDHPDNGTLRSAGLHTVTPAC